MKVSKHTVSILHLSHHEPVTKTWHVSPDPGPASFWTAVGDNRERSSCQEPRFALSTSTDPGKTGKWQQKEKQWHRRDHGMWYQLQIHWTKSLFLLTCTSHRPGQSWKLTHWYSRVCILKVQSQLLFVITIIIFIKSKTFRNYCNSHVTKSFCDLLTQHPSIKCETLESSHNT